MCEKLAEEAVVFLELVKTCTEILKYNIYTLVDTAFYFNLTIFPHWDGVSFGLNMEILIFRFLFRFSVYINPYFNGKVGVVVMKFV